MTSIGEGEKRVLERERNVFLRQIQNWLELPMIILAFIWLVLLIIEFLRGLTPFLQAVITVIWILFVLDFLLRFWVAPQKLTFLKYNVLTAVSLVLPALRLFRIIRIIRLLRLARAIRGLRLIRVVSSLNRGVRALRASMGRRRVGYVALMTLIILLVGAAGMYAFEQDPTGEAGFTGYGDALWWTAMLLTTVGSEYWPQTAEGRILCLMLSIYSLGVLGYVTATLASFFIGRDAEDASAEIAGEKALQATRKEIEALRLEIRKLLQER